MKMLILAAVAMLAATAPGLASDAKLVVEEQNVAFEQAIKAGDAKAVANLYTADAMIFPPGAPTATGRDAIKAYWAAGVAGGVAGVDLVTDEATRLGGDIIEVGRYSITGADGAAIGAGKYMVHWKNSDGAWRLYRDIWNAD